MKPVISRVDWSERKQDLLAVRHAVFVEEQGVPFELEQDAFDPQALHLLVTDTDGHAIATARMLPDGHVGRMAVLPAWRGRGIGSSLIKELIRIAGEQGTKALFLNAQIGAVPFYQRFGFAPSGDIFVDAGIDHRRMGMHLASNPD